MRVLRIVPILFVLMGLALVSTEAVEDSGQHIFKAMGAPSHPKVEVVWNRLYDTDGLAGILKGLRNAYPDLTRLYSLGISHGGRQIWCLEVTHRKKGDPRRKPGMLFTGNIHGNEVQASEVVAYTAWYLCELSGQNKTIDDLLDHYVFYLVPTINPDGRDYFFHSPGQLRSGIVPLDNDKDGLLDEDGPDDLNGDGQISLMYLRDSNGRWKKHPEYPNSRMVPAKQDERGEYTFLGSEGIDNDGDGRINEDGVGGYDSNRNFAWDWQPWYVQYGAVDFPFSLPNTHAVAKFVLSHPNIATSQSYHNSGGLILRGPEWEGGEMQPSDARLLDAVGERGVKMIPFYKFWVSGIEFYVTLGDEAQWLYGARGIYAFCNEFWTNEFLFHKQPEKDAQAEFIKYLLLDEAVIEWEEYDHPAYGKIEIGGIKKEFGRMAPSFMLEEEYHRNMMFTLYHASTMPRIEFGNISVEPVSDNLFKIWVEIRNDAMLPTRSGQDIMHTINHPDIVSVNSNRCKVISSGIVTDKYLKTIDLVRIRPERIELAKIPGLDSVIVQFVVSGEGTAEITVDSVKGGVIQAQVVLE